MLRGIVVSVCVLFFAVVASAMNGRTAPERAVEPRWESSFSAPDAGFSVELPTRERRWIRATELEPGFEGFTCRDSTKHTLYTVIFGRPKKAWTAKDAREFLEGVEGVEPRSRVQDATHQGLHGFELVAASRERTARYRVFADGPLVVIASVISAAEHADAARFFESLHFKR